MEGGKARGAMFRRGAEGFPAYRRPSVRPSVRRRLAPVCASKPGYNRAAAVVLQGRGRGAECRPTAALSRTSGPRESHLNPRDDRGGGGGVMWRPAVLRHRVLSPSNRT